MYTHVIDFSFWQDKFRKLHSGATKHSNKQIFLAARALAAGNTNLKGCVVEHSNIRIRVFFCEHGKQWESTSQFCLPLFFGTFSGIQLDRHLSNSACWSLLWRSVEQSCPQPVVTRFHLWRLSEDQNIDHYINSRHNYHLKLISVLTSKIKNQCWIKFSLM